MKTFELITGEVLVIDNICSLSDVREQVRMSFDLPEKPPTRITTGRHLFKIVMCNGEHTVIGSQQEVNSIRNALLMLIEGNI